MVISAVLQYYSFPTEGALISNRSVHTGSPNLELGMTFHNIPLARINSKMGVPIVYISIIC